MAEKLTPAKVEEAVKHYENIQSGKTPILKTDKEKTTEHITDLHRHLKKKDNKTFPLIPPTDPRLLMKIAEFSDDMLKQFLTLPSSICGWPPITNIRNGKPT